MVETPVRKVRTIGEADSVYNPSSLQLDRKERLTIKIDLNIDQFHLILADKLPLINLSSQLKSRTVEHQTSKNRHNKTPKTLEITKKFKSC